MLDNKGVDMDNQFLITDYKAWLYVNVNTFCKVEQGWKGHLSTRLKDCDKILEISIPILIKNNCDFKIIKNKSLLKL